MVTIFVVEHFNGKKTVNCEIQGTTTPKRHRRVKEAKLLKVVFFFYSLTCKGKRNKSIVIMSLKPATKIV